MFRQSWAWPPELPAGTARTARVDDEFTVLARVTRTYEQLLP
jgi:hypothetical protein